MKCQWWANDNDLKFTKKIKKYVQVGFRVADYESVAIAIAKTTMHDDFGENMYSGIFGVADNESVIRFS